MSDSGLERFILDKLEKLDDKLDQVREESTKLTVALEAHEGKDEAIHRDVREMADKFTSQLGQQCKQLQQYNEHLQEHMKRSDQLEESHKEMWKRVEPVVKAHEDNKIVKKYFSEKATRRMKWIGWIGTIAGALYAVLKLTGMF